jgi:hypothetical protein
MASNGRKVYYTPFSILTVSFGTFGMMNILCESYSNYKKCGKNWAMGH